MAPPNLAWGGFKNGQIPRANLVDVGGGKLAQADAARGLAELAEAFHAKWGASLYLAADQDAYRDLARQRYMLDHPELYPYAHALPGSSIHGWARSFDLSGYTKVSHPWLVENAPRFGISWAYGRELNESWHFDYIGPITTTAGGGGGGTVIKEKDEDMTYGIRNDFPDEKILPGFPKDAVLIGHGTDPLVWVSNAGPEDINGVVIAGWNATQIAERIGQVGIRGSGADLGKVFKSLPDAQAGHPVYALGESAGGSFTLDAATIQALATANAAAFFAEQKKPGN